MTSLTETLRFFLDAANWVGSDGVPTRLLEHLRLSTVATLVALAIALPLGLWLGHTGRGGQLAINVSNVGRAVPTFGIVLLAVTLLSIGPLPILIALVALAVPPILTNTFVGIRAVDPDVRDAAVGMGLSDLRVLRRVEVPMALPLIMTGVRTSAVQVVATAAIAPYGGLSEGLGVYIRNGIPQRRIGEVIAGALLVALLALAVEFLLGRVERALTSEGLKAPAARDAAVRPATTGSLS